MVITELTLSKITNITYIIQEVIVMKYSFMSFSGPELDLDKSFKIASFMDTMGLNLA